MAFKINKSIIQGTTGHASALKQTKDADGTINTPKVPNPKIKTIEKIDHNKNLKNIKDPKERSKYYDTHKLEHDKTTSKGKKRIVDGIKKSVNNVFKNKKKEKEDTITVGDVAKTIATVPLGIPTNSSKKVFKKLGREAKKGYKKVKNKVTNVWNTEL